MLNLNKFLKLFENSNNRYSLYDLSMLEEPKIKNDYSFSLELLKSNELHFYRGTNLNINPNQFAITNNIDTERKPIVKRNKLFSEVFNKTFKGPHRNKSNIFSTNFQWSEIFAIGNNPYFVLPKNNSTIALMLYDFNDCPFDYLFLQNVKIKMEFSNIAKCIDFFIELFVFLSNYILKNYENIIKSSGDNSILREEIHNFNGIMEERYNEKNFFGDEPFLNSKNFLSILDSLSIIYENNKNKDLLRKIQKDCAKIVDIDTNPFEIIKKWYLTLKANQKNIKIIQWNLSNYNKLKREIQEGKFLECWTEDEIIMMN